MDTAGTSPERRERAEAIYAKELSACGSADRVDVDALCAAHPELVEELRDAHVAWRRVMGIHDLVVAGGSVGERLLKRFGTDLDPKLSLGGEPDSPAPSMSNRVLRRLEDHAPRQSRYRSLGEVARGGMGAIYEVWDADLRRKLAMKVVLGQAAAASGSSVAERSLGRFLEEAQVTGQLDHPGVVPVHELGVDEDGRVYFTMRLVRGRNFEEIIDLVHRGEQSWTVTRALQVVLKICETVAFAHDKGVLHRDLKPANVMVGRFGEVYVMDWGLARVLGREDSRDLRMRTDSDSGLRVATDRTESVSGSAIHTMDGDVVGTPAYMPPEQARGLIDQLDSRSDVYAVGAILYHLLAGHMPYAPPGSDRNIIAVWELVVAGEPEPLHERAPDAPAELVAICEKAMTREPTERYADAQELAEDLHSYLEGRVVRAYETGALAELKKWVRRNRSTAIASAAAVALALGGLGTAGWLEARANSRLGAKNVELAAATLQAQQNEAQAVREKERADLNSRLAEERALEATRQRDAADRVIAFLEDLFESSDPELARGERMTAKELLDQGAREITTELVADPLVRARLMAVMGTAYRSLGLYEDAQPLLEGAADMRAQELGSDDPTTLSTQRDLAVLYRLQGRYANASQLLETTLERERASLGPEDPATLQTRSELAKLRYEQGHVAEAESLLRSLVERERELLGPDDPSAVRTRRDLGLLLRGSARYAEAREVLQEVLETRRSTLGDDHPATLRSANDLAGLDTLEQRYDAAEERLRETLANRERVLGPDHPETLVTRLDLAFLLLQTQRFSKARDLYEDALARSRRILGDEHPFTLTALNNLASSSMNLGRFEEARPLLEEAVEMSPRVNGEQHPNTLGAINGLAFVYAALGRPDDAEPLYLRALDGLRETYGPGHPWTVTALDNLVRLYRDQERYGEAEPLARDMVDLTASDWPEHAHREALLESILEGLAESSVASENE